MTISSGPEEIYMYRLIALRTANGEEIVACAARRNGVAAMKFKGEGQEHALQAFSSEGLDVVDLCPLKIGPSETGVAAVGKDGTIILFQDILTDRNPVAIRYPDIKGTPYRLLSINGYLFFLTSAGFYAIAGLINRPLRRNCQVPMTPVLFVPMEAVDAYLGGNQWVLIAMPDGVLRFDVELLDSNEPADLALGELKQMQPTSMYPAWIPREIRQESRLAMAGAES